MDIEIAQSMPTAAPTAASNPAAGTLKLAKAPFDLLDEVGLLPLLEPEPEPETEEPPLVEAAGLSVGVADDGGYAAPNALISKGCETA